MTGLERRQWAGVVITLLMPALIVWIPGAVGAQEASIEIPITTLVTGPEGSEHLLASEQVPGFLEGSTCTARAVAENQSSVHPDNDLVIASGDQQAVLEDVEREPGAETVTQEPLVLGEELTVTLIMGPDGVFSAGLVVEVLCEPSETTTTTEGTTTTTVERTTTTVEATTTTPRETTTTEVLGTTTTPQETTTTEVLGTTTSSEPDDETEGTLPFTGGGTRGAAGVALAALTAGMGLVVLSSRTGDDGPSG